MPTSDIEISYLVPYESVVQNIIAITAGYPIMKKLRMRYDLHRNSLALKLDQTISIEMNISAVHLLLKVYDNGWIKT